ncbi:hypothetical protein CO666_27685 [Rhizobium chutanense]|uniref:Uncharacterized protein n=1 Tax=Rhizobium chutanense TaxID=2035448 RepID=A0A2A6J4I9_9HYPH|nr:hypothetical protein [Rhizobium chutanense]PDT00921.1 hypothetical protein CO666_27685 [Rhizobium chutanense]
MKFKIDILIDLCPGAAGLLIPVFKIEGSNLPFVQEMDESFEVYDMQPYIAVENYEYCLPPQVAATDIGEKGIIAFRSFDDAIFVGDVSDVLAFRDSNRLELPEVPMLDLQLARICAEPVSLMHSKWKAVGSRHLGESRTQSWSDGEFSLFQKNRLIWENINTIRDNPKDTFIENLNSHSFEYLFRWLVGNTLSQHWAKVWIRAFKLSPFDERIHAIAEPWLRNEMAQNSFIKDIKLILFCYLDDLTKYDPDRNDFKEILTEYLISRSDDLHEILLPSSLPYLIFKNIDTEQEENDGFLAFLYFFLKERLSGDRRYEQTLKNIESYWSE